MSFDPTVTLGNVLTIISLLAGALVFAFKVSARLTRLETKVDVLFQRFLSELRAGESE